MTKQELVNSYVTTCCAMNAAGKIKRQPLDDLTDIQAWTFALQLENAAWLAMLRDPFPKGSFVANFRENLSDFEEIWGVTIPQV